MNDFVMRLNFKEDHNPYLLDISSLLYDLELAHDLCVSVLEDDYSNFVFGQYFFYRNGRPLKKSHRIRTARIVHNSPLLLEVIVPSMAAVLGFIQIVEKVQNWSLNREKLELEVSKLQREEQRDREQISDFHVESLNRELESRNAKGAANNIINRLEKSSIKLTDLEVFERDAANKDS